ncbi:MAG: stalk domain-containing protein [Moorellales bacterium]
MLAVWCLPLSAGPALAQVHEWDITSRSQGEGGTCWQPIGPDVPGDCGVWQVVASPNFVQDQTLFAVAYRANASDMNPRVFASYDGGSSWHPALNQLVTVVGVSPDFAQDGTLIAANTSGKVFISRDRGQTWEGTTDIASNTAWALAFSPSFVQDKTIFLGGAKGLLASTDGGYHWQTLAGAPLNIKCLAVSPDFARDRTLFAGVTGSYEKNGLYRSADGGKTWEQVAALKGIPVTDVAFSPNYLQDRVVYAVGGGHLFKSTDGGGTWGKISITGANGYCLAISPQFAADKTIFIGAEGTGVKDYDGVVKCKDGLQERLVCGLIGKTVRDLAAADTGTGIKLYAAVMSRDYRDGKVYALSLPSEGGTPPAPVTKEGLVQRGIEYPFWLEVAAENARYALLKDPAHPEEYDKLSKLLGERARVTGYLDTGPGFPDPVQGHIRVIRVEPVQGPVAGQVIINDPSFVTLTAVPNGAPGADTAFNLEVKANNPALPVELSYLVLDPNATPANPASGVEVHPDGECETGWASGQHFYHTEIGGWSRPQFATNPQSFPLPHYRTCILMLARYEKLYVVFLRENDGQLTYRVLQGGPFTGLDVPGLAKVTRQGNRFEVRSYGGPVEVSLWAKGQYFHDEVAGWTQPEFKENPKYYEIPHYGMFMLMIARYDKVGLVLGNENDGQLGAVVLTGSHGWTTPEVVQDLCAVRGTGGPQVEVRATGGDPVEVSHFAFDNTCWQWEVNGWGKAEFAPNPQTFALKHYTPGFLMVSRYGKAGIFFYNENDGQLGVLPVEAAAPPGYPSEPQAAAVFRVGQKYYRAGGQDFPMDVAPFVKNGRTYLSIRYLANALGVRDQDITWDPRTRKAALRKGDVTLYFMVGSREMLRADSSTSSKNFVQMDVTPEIANGRICLPARYVAEGFGYRVQWDPSTQAILVLLL